MWLIVPLALRVKTRPLPLKKENESKKYIFYSICSEGYVRFSEHWHMDEARHVPGVEQL